MRTRSQQTDASGTPVEQQDIVIIGAGLSGINTAHTIKERLPHRDFIILEGREVIGGTWNFFKYPGFRSDSPLSTFGYRWHPWKHKHLIAKGHEIVEYLDDAARTDGSYDKIRFSNKVTDLEWLSDEQRWVIDVNANGERRIIKAKFVVSCAGYYSYTQALHSPIQGLEDFKGTVIHPQWWPEDVDHAGKRVVVIGSGATAITIVPTLAETAANVVQLQRSPSYVASRPNGSALLNFFRLFMPLYWAHWLSWWNDTLYEMIMSSILLYFPTLARFGLALRTRRELPSKVDQRIHFNPKYNPFEQRLCLCPDGDFFKALHRDNVEIVTDHIDTVTADGILLKSGKKLEADIIVTATGLHLEFLGGVKPKVDGKVMEAGDLYTWRGCMLENMPNMAYIMGYVTQSWTPAATVMGNTVCKVISNMEQKGATSITPVIKRYKGMPRKIAVEANSTYFLRAADRVPKVTGEGPWYGRKNLAIDTWALWFSDLNEGLVFNGGSVDKKNA